METVHIYAEVGNVAPRSMRRTTAYILEYITASGQTVTREEFRERDATYNAAVLQAISDALGRMTKSCEIHLHTQNRYVLNMIEHRLKIWAANGFCNTRGEPVANQKDWEKLWELGQEHLLVPEPGMHGYYGWMADEMRRREDEGQDSREHRAG